ncbi:MAG: DUF1232 domain-containing protein [Anaerolineae bacterium]|nr:MAG: DUF1232 domain-containing protein [Anaerolineae bacterium]
MWQRWKQRARTLQREIHAIALACRDPRTPWYARLLALCVLGYALSPLDLIPDVIPILGALDDLVLLPAGIALVLRLIPPQVMRESRQQASQLSAAGTLASRVVTTVILLCWVLLGLSLVRAFI